MNPTQPRILKKLENSSYNYWDYIQAWHYAFYYQNPIRKHTWLFCINPDICTNLGFPTWFLLWWEKMGPELSILPKQINDYFLIWYHTHPILKGKIAKNPPIGRNTLWFFAEFRIVWIWKWDFSTRLRSVKNPYFTKNFLVQVVGQI